MAKQSTKKRRSTTKKSNRKAVSKSANKVSYPRRKEILGLILMVLALLLLLSITTFSPLDRIVSLSEMFNGDPKPADNALGLVGAFISYLLVERLLGFPIAAFTILLFLAGYKVFRHQSTRPLRWVSLLTGLGVLITSCIMGWLTIVGQADLSFWSGDLGLSIAQGLRRILGSAGSFILLSLLTAIGVLLSIDRDIQRSIDRIEGFFSKISQWVKTEWLAHSIKEKKPRKEKAKQEKSEAKDSNESTLRSEAEERERQRMASLQDGDVEDDRLVNDLYVGSKKAEKEAPPSGKIELDVTPNRILEKRPSLTLVQEKNDEPEEVELDIIEVDVSKDVDNLDKVHRVAADIPEYKFPSTELLDDDSQDVSHIDRQELEENKQILLDKLATYNIEITRIGAIVGPTVTLYELTPAPGVKISKIKSLQDDLAMAMAAPGIRMIAPIPGKSAVGVEIPNRNRELVRIKTLLNTRAFTEAKMELPVAIGKTIEGKVFVEDLTKMPHLLVAGATGSGKSVGINNLIANLLYACEPSNLKFVIVDPKKIEMQQYAQIYNHFIAMPEGSEDPITTDTKDAMKVLKSCLQEMENRYDLLSGAGVRGIKDYNKKFKGGLLPDGEGHKLLPYIVLIIDELADLMMTAGKEIEGPIARLAQMARAVGLHLVVATQRPSVNVITGLIKANFPARIAFKVASGIDSRTIIDQHGAEHLVGNGDLLYMNGSKTIRLQSPFVSLEEVERVTGFIGGQKGVGPYYLPAVMDDDDTVLDGQWDKSNQDDLFAQAAKIIVRSQQGSVSLLQRKLSVGYTRAARIVDQLESAGIVGPFEGSKARQVLVPDEIQLDQLLKS